MALTASPEALEGRLRADIAAGKRRPDVIPRSLARLPLYDEVDAVKIDTSALTAEEAAACIAGAGREEK